MKTFILMACFCMPPLVLCAESSQSSASTYFLAPVDITNSVRLAHQGDAKTAFRLAQFYIFASPNETNSVVWLKRAAELGHTTAQYNLAFHYQYDVKPPHIEEAVSLYRASAKGGNSKAMEALGELYSTGTGVTVSTNTSIKWYERAAQRGSIDAMEKVAVLLRENKNDRAYLWAKVAAIRCAKANLNTNDQFRGSMSTNLSSRARAALDKEADILERKIPRQ